MHQLLGMGVRKYFSMGATATFCLPFSNCWRCIASRH